MCDLTRVRERRERVFCVRTARVVDEVQRGQTHAEDLLLQPAQTAKIVQAFQTAKVSHARWVHAPRISGC